jgi:acyl-CoA thioester hydrolase
VYFEDTDFSGLVYHTSYLRWCERGRSDYLRLLGITHTRLLEGAFGLAPSAFAVRRIAADFIKPAHIDDVLEVVTAPSDITKASVMLSQQICRDGVPIFRLQAQCVLVSLDGRLQRISAEIATALGGQGAPL